MNTEKLVWNGCDGYMFWSDAQRDSDYRTDEEALYTTHDVHRPFLAVEIDPNTLPRYDDGDIDYDGVMSLANGRTFRPL